MTESRIYYARDLKRYADEHIELPYAQLQARTLSAEDRAAVPVLIDPLARAYLRDGYRISIKAPLCSHLHAAKWASQFGKLRVWKAGDINVAHIEGHCTVWAHTPADACILAAIQVLREHSIACLTTQGQSVN